MAVRGGTLNALPKEIFRVLSIFKFGKVTFSHAWKQERTRFNLSDELTFNEAIISPLIEVNRLTKSSEKRRRCTSVFELFAAGDDQAAVISHYVYNLHFGCAKKYKQEALKAIEEFQANSLNSELRDKSASEIIAEFSSLMSRVPFPIPREPCFQFIDLFAGIGGFRVALQNLGGHCIFSSEWDKESKKTYAANFGEVPFGDITSQCVKDAIPPKFEVLCAGFPCQAFSIAGRRGGFEDTRGTLFFEVAEIILKHKPQAFFLENVKGLRNHNGGRTLETILNVLRNDLGYHVPDPQIINANDFGLPQHRERIYIVGFRKKSHAEAFKYPQKIKRKSVFADVKEDTVVMTKYYLSTQYLGCLRRHRARHENKGNGFGFSIIADTEVANAVVCGGMGRERNLVLDHRITDFTAQTRIQGEVNREGIRKMTPREWARLQGFPDRFVIPVADASAYKQFGNSVAVPAIQATAKMILKAIGK